MWKNSEIKEEGGEKCASLFKPCTFIISHHPPNLTHYSFFKTTQILQGIP
jgi:hypothetical protein